MAVRTVACSTAYTGPHRMRVSLAPNSDEPTTSTTPSPFMSSTTMTGGALSGPPGPPTAASAAATESPRGDDVLANTPGPSNTTWRVGRERSAFPAESTNGATTTTTCPDCVATTTSQCASGRPSGPVRSTATIEEGEIPRFAERGTRGITPSGVLSWRMRDKEVPPPSWSTEATISRCSSPSPSKATTELTPTTPDPSASLVAKTEMSNREAWRSLGVATTRGTSSCEAITRSSKRSSFQVTGITWRAPSREGAITCVSSTEVSKRLYPATTFPAIPMVATKSMLPSKFKSASAIRLHKGQNSDMTRPSPSPGKAPATPLEATSLRNQLMTNCLSYGNTTSGAPSLSTS